MNYSEYTPQWYVLKIKTGWDEKIAEQLLKSGYEAFIPLVDTPNTEKGISKKKSLFPGYAFVCMSRNQILWAQILQIYGVLGWVKFEETIPFLTESALDKIKKTIADLNETGGLWNRYTAGDSVIINNLSIDTFGEVLEDVKSPDSFVQVIMQFMGRMVKASVHVSRLSVSNPDITIYRNRGRRTRGNGRLIKSNI